MIPAKFFGPRVETVDFVYNKPVNLFINKFNVKDIVKDEINILILLEPYAMRKILGYSSLEEIIKNEKLFNFIITFDSFILKSCFNARKWIYGHCSIDSEYGSVPKKFGISALTGNKHSTEGHWLRLEFYNKQNRIKKIPRSFYVSNRTPLANNSFNNPLLGGAADDKIKLFDTMFHLCIENSRETDYFTEKLIDCMRGKTVPLYFGCPNIHEFFLIEGIIIIEDYVDGELGGTINKLTPELYYKMLPAVEENYILAEDYINFPKRLKDFIGELIR